MVYFEDNIVVSEIQEASVRGYVQSCLLHDGIIHPSPPYYQRGDKSSHHYCTHCTWFPPPLVPASLLSSTLINDYHAVLTLQHYPSGGVEAVPVTARGYIVRKVNGFGNDSSLYERCLDIFHSITKKYVLMECLMDAEQIDLKFVSNEKGKK